MRPFSVKVFLFLSLLSSHLYAESKTGVSCFACLNKNYPCADFLNLFKDSSVKFTSVLSGTFGENLSCLERFVKLPGEIIIEIHGSNGSGRRFNRLGQGEIAPSLTREKWRVAWHELSPTVTEPYKKEVISWAAFATKYPFVHWIYSDELESDDDLKAVKARINLIREYWPYDISTNPLYFSSSFFSASGSDLIELHGSRPRDRNFGRRCITNNDGSTVDFKSKAKNSFSSSLFPVLGYLRKGRDVCEYVLLWDGVISNGENNSRKWIAPKERKFFIPEDLKAPIHNLLIRANGKL